MSDVTGWDGPQTFTGVVRFLQRLKGPDHWHYVGATGEPAFQNSWVNEGIYQAARFMKDVVGVVRIEGLVKSGSSTIFTLPVGYRPPDRLLISTLGDVQRGRFDIIEDGNVTYNSGGNGWFAINHSFYVG